MPPGRAAPAGPGAAPGAGGAWSAGVLVRGSGRHCAGRETAPVSRCSGRIARHVPGAGIVVCGRCPLSEGRSAPSGPLWLRRSGPRKACGPELCRHLPQGSVKVWGQLADSLAPRGSQRGQRNGQGSWPGCQLRLCRVASPLLGSMQGQEPPQTPPRRNAANPRRVGYRASFRPG